MLENLIGAVISVLASLISHLPASPINFNTYLEPFRSMMSYINWFIPFYRFAAIANAFLVAFFGGFAVIFIIKFVVKKMGR